MSAQASCTDYSIAYTLTPKDKFDNDIAWDTSGFMTLTTEVIGIETVAKLSMSTTQNIALDPTWERETPTPGYFDIEFELTASASDGTNEIPAVSTTLIIHFKLVDCAQ